MGHKFSTVHGVKSSDYSQAGNAINEIWYGDVELVSRLPFGDSDMAQASWHPGDWPKIPWHNFIIPWKRDVLVDSNAYSSPIPGGGSIRGRGRLRTQGLGGVSYAVSLVLAAAFAVLVCVAYYIPVRIRRITPRVRELDDLDEQAGGVGMGWYAVRAGIATTSLFLGLGVAAVEFLVVTPGEAGVREGALLVVLRILWAGMAVFGFVYSASAVGSLWMDCRDVSKRKRAGEGPGRCKVSSSWCWSVS